MKQFFNVLFVASLTAASALAQADPNSQPIPLYENFGVVDTSEVSPQIDALAFANYGYFSVTTSPFVTELPTSTVNGPFAVFPYDFQNVINFTNSGTILGYTGVQFDTAYSDQPRRPANNFVNTKNGQITTAFFNLISATNVSNQGILSTTANGRIEVKGGNVNLSYGGLEVQPQNPGGGVFCSYNGYINTPTNFYEPGVFGQLWQINTNLMDLTTFVSTNFDGTVRVRTPLFSLGQAVPYLFTNRVTETNWIVQAAFVELLNTNFTGSARFYKERGANAGFPGRTIAVSMTTTETNIVTGAVSVRGAYVTDFMLTSTNLAFQTNIVDGTLRPATLLVSLVPPCQFLLGSSPNSVLLGDTFSSKTYSNLPTVTNINALYDTIVFAGSSSANPSPSPSVTNDPGRVEITAANLDMTSARIRGESLVSIKAKHLISSTNAAVDVSVLNYDLGSTNGLLTLQNLAAPANHIFNGEVIAWSGVWTNYTGSITNVVGPDPNDPTITVTNKLTNVVEIIFHALVVGNAIQTDGGASTVNDFAMHSQNVQLLDNLTISGKVNIDASSLTVSSNATLILAGGVEKNWNAASVPRLTHLTNFGSIQVANQGKYGTDRAMAYAHIVNQGNMSAFSQEFRADDFENSGLISASSRISMIAASAKLDGGRFTAGEGVVVSGGVVKVRNYNITATTLQLAVTDYLSDSGLVAKNSFQCSDGFQLTVKPATGDLFGTTLRSVVAPTSTSLHLWAAADLGATAAGFKDNAVVGHLVLKGAADSQLSFRGVTSGNALYVDYLDLQGEMTNNLAAALNIAPNFTIYFADANLDAATLDGLNNGRLRWVSSFAGPNSAVDVLLLSGQTIKVNRSLLNSATIDSDGDGIANRYDLHPFDADPVQISGVALTPGTPFGAELSMGSPPKSVYQIEFTTNLASPKWEVYGVYTNSLPAAGVFKILLQNPLPAGSQQRFYRVRYNQ